MGVEVEGVRVVVDDLDALRDALADLPEAWRQIGEADAQLAATLAPRRSGRLAGTVQVLDYRGRAVITAGSARVPYAGVQNYGWAARRIRATHYLDRAGEQTEHLAEQILTTEANREIRQKGF